MQIDVLERRLLCFRIGETHILEAYAILRMRPLGRRAGRLGHLRLQVLVQGRQVQVVLVHAANR